MQNNNNNFGGFFAKIVEQANSSTNSEKAKEIRKKLIKYGVIGAIISGILVLTGFISFAASGMSAANTASFGVPPGIIVSMIIFMIGGIGTGISSTAIKAGLSIVVAGIASNILDANKYCPKCKDRIDDDEIFCNKCGHNLRANKLCVCGTQNDINDNFCKACGKGLN